MIKTRITELFAIKHPIMLAGMNWITEPKIVAAVCNAGGLGVLAIAHLTAEEARRDIGEIRTLTDKPFGINQALLLPNAKENIEVAIEEKVPIINYGLGRPWFVEQVHAYGGKVMASVALARHAVRAEQLGVDIIVIIGHEAASHGADGTSLVLVPIVASQVKVPVIAAGGFYDGRGLAAALALGAEAVSMGTRFMVTKESIVHENFKKLCMQASEQDTLYSDVFDGMPSRVLKTKIAEEMMKRGFPLFEGMSSALEIKRMLGLSTWGLIRASLGMMKGEERLSLLQQARQAAGAVRLEKAIYQGDEKEGLMYVGQNCGGIRDVLTCKELIELTVAEAEATLKTICNQVHP